MTKLNEKALECAIGALTKVYNAEDFGLASRKDQCELLAESAIQAYKENEWMDISEAPRDGTEIILANFEPENCMERTPMLADYWYQDREQGGFDEWGEAYPDFSPTHFQHITKPKGKDDDNTA